MKNKANSPKTTIRSDSLKIIFIISFSPVYHYLHEEDIPARALQCWTNKAGQYVGVWDKDWGVVIGDEILTIMPNWQYEVWRPDLRADQIYCYTKPNGVVLRSFPSSFIKARFGLKSRLEEYSESLEEALEELCRRSEPILLILPIGNDLFFQRIYGRFGKRAPFLNPHFLNNDMLLCRTQFSFHPGKFLHRWRLNRNFAQWLSKLCHVTLPQQKYYHELERKYGWQVSFFAAGFNPDDYPRDNSRATARSRLKIDSNVFVLLCSSRVVPEKQIDKLLMVLSMLQDLDWKCYITGSGPDRYVKQIRQLIESLGLKDRVYLVGYVSDENLRCYYQSADLFFMTSTKEAGPGSANLAAWYGLPMISTRTGSVAELLEQEGAGYLVETENYAEWKEALRFAFERNRIRTLDEQVLLHHKGRRNNMERMVKTLQLISTAWYPSVR